MSNFDHLKNFIQMHGIDPEVAKEVAASAKTLEDVVADLLSVFDKVSSSPKTETGSTHRHATPDAAKIRRATPHHHLLANYQN